MADTTAVFDKLVFAFAFDIMDIVPVILRVSLERQYYKVAAGQAVPITLYIIDNMTTPGRQFLFNPAVGPTITIYNPDDTVQQASVNMPQVETGIFTYIHQTDVSDVIGAYSALFTASNGDSVMVSKKHHIFSIV